MGTLRQQGPLCQFHGFSGIDSGTTCRHASPAPGPVDGLSLWPEIYNPGFLPAALGLSEAITRADKAEFAVIQKMGVCDRGGRPYHTVNSYISDRTLYFGSPEDYTTFAAESDAELAGTKWKGKKRTRTLRSLLEFGDHLDRERIFYRWVRKAYKDKYGRDANVPELIRKGMSDELARKIAEVRGSIRVRKAGEQDFHTGGFNPRPMKLCGRYRLGTLSKHATGMAVDIDDEANAQFNARDWAFIEHFVHKHVVRKGRWKTEADAQGLWEDIQEVNDLFVKKIASELLRMEETRAAGAAQAAVAHGSAAPHSHAKSKSPLREILGKHFTNLSLWSKSGFFHLPLDLVLELHFRGFVWGATFHGNVDLHHFELKE